LTDNEKSNDDETKKPEENKESERAKEPEPSKDKLVTLNMRVTPAIKEALKKISPEGKMTAKVTELIENEAKQSGAHIQIDVSYERLVSEVEEHQQELQSIKKALSSRFDLINAVAQKTTPLTVENVDTIIKGLLTYKVSSQDDFTERDKNTFINWLETWQKSKKAEKIRDKLRAEKYGVTIPEAENVDQGPAVQERYISEKDSCKCSYLPKHTLFEHNQRAFHIHDGMLHGINQFINTPQKILDRISQMGMDHTSSKEEKELIVKYLIEHGSYNQKVMVNDYFFSHNFPMPFPECMTNELIEKQKDVVPWKPEKSDRD